MCMKENDVYRSTVNSSHAAPMSGCLSQRKEFWGEQRGHMHGRIPWQEEKTEHVPTQTWVFNC